MDKNLLLVMLTQLISSIAIIYSIKADVAWLKETQRNHDKRLSKVESLAYGRRMTDHVS
jgi:hypothetical protein